MTASVAAPARRAPAYSLRHLAWDILGLVLLVGAIVGVGRSFSAATAGAAATVYYGLFWLALAPVWIWLGITAVAWRHAWRSYHLGILVVASWFPKFLRNPDFALYHDEIAHVRAVADLLSTGQFFRPNPLIPVIGEFPGLHALTGVVAATTGLSVFAAGSVVVGAAHLVTLTSVQSLGRSLTGAPRVGAIAAVVYATNPNALYFDNQFAYESLGVALFAAALAFAAKAQRARQRRTEVGPVWQVWATAAVLAAAVCVVGHALSTLFLLVVLGLVSAVHAVAGVGARRRRAAHGAVVTWAAVTGLVAVTTGAWLALVARDTLAYLAPYPLQAVEQLSKSARGGGGSRTLFVGSVQPAYEHYASYLAQLALLVLMGGLVVLLFPQRRHWRRHPTVVAMLGLALLYFPSALFILAPQGAEGARRSWAFIYVGLGVGVGLFVELMVRRSGAPPRRRQGLRRTLVLRPVLVVGVIVVLLVGNVSAGLNDPYRFPGPYRFGSDTRDRPPETRALAAQFAVLDTTGKVITDRYTAMALVQDGTVDPGIFSAGFPGSEVLTEDRDPSPALVDGLRHADYRYIVVDERAAVLKPLVGWYFAPEQPPAGMTDATLSAATLDRLDQVPWAACVLRSDHYAVYRVDWTQVKP